MVGCLANLSDAKQKIYQGSEIMRILLREPLYYLLIIRTHYEDVYNRGVYRSDRVADREMSRYPNPE